MGALLQHNPDKLDNLRRGYSLYAKWYEDAHPEVDGESLFLDQGRKYVTEIYNQTAAIAPSPGQIASDVQRQGWRIPRKFADGRLGRGWPQQWTGNAYWQALKQKLIRKKRGRNARQANIEQENAIRDAKPTLQQMQAFVIKIRTDANKFLASGWLGAILDLGGSAKNSSGKADRGGAEIHRSPGRAEIILWNETPGMAEMDEKKQIVAKAKLVRIADMLVYVRRKMEEAARRYLRAA